jgi:hypothetical protein
VHPIVLPSAPQTDLGFCDGTQPLSTHALAPPSAQDPTAPHRGTHAPSTHAESRLPQSFVTAHALPGASQMPSAVRHKKPLGHCESMVHAVTHLPSTHAPEAHWLRSLQRSASGVQRPSTQRALFAHWWSAPHAWLSAWTQATPEPLVTTEHWNWLMQAFFEQSPE